jgi:hypothetical protein
MKASLETAERQGLRGVSVIADRRGIIVFSFHDPRGIVNEYVVCAQECPLAKQKERLRDLIPAFKTLGFEPEVIAGRANRERRLIAALEPSVEALVAQLRGRRS